MKLVAITCSFLTACLFLSACGDGEDQDPLDVEYGATTLVLLLNPVVNDTNQAELPTPGDSRGGLDVELDDGPNASSDQQGLAVLSPVPAGSRTISVDGGVGTVSTSIAEGDLQELVLASEGDRLELMDKAIYAFGGQVIEVNPEMPVSEVNQALADSQSIVFFSGGEYEGDLVFAGSDVTLFGAGMDGGQVVLTGNVTVAGSGNRIRGATIVGSLSIQGSDTHIAFSRLEGPVDVTGSSVSLIHNTFCQTLDLGGSGSVVLDNAGLPPIDRPEDCDAL